MKVESATQGSPLLLLRRKTKKNKEINAVTSEK